MKFYLSILTIIFGILTWVSDQSKTLLTNLYIPIRLVGVWRKWLKLFKTFRIKFTTAETSFSHETQTDPFPLRIAVSRHYFDFFDEWLNRFRNPITVICFEEMVQDPVGEIGKMLKFLQFPPYRSVFYCYGYDDRFPSC